MNFNKHLNLSGCHAFLSASQFHWIRYSDEKVIDKYAKQQAAKKGTELHDFASKCIQLGQKLPQSKKTLNSFVNDAIGYRMETEQVLFYSENCFGTADAISYSEKDHFLRIHDLKTGTAPACIDQLKIYAAFFCLEYGEELGIKNDPSKIGMELRIYQSDNIITHLPDPEEIKDIMDRTITGNDIIENLKSMEVK